MSRRGNYQDSVAAPITRECDDDAVAQDDEDEQDEISLEVDKESDILSAVEKVRPSISPCSESILTLLTSFEKLSVLCDQVHNANRAGFVKSPHFNINTMEALLDDHSL